MAVDSSSSPSRQPIDSALSPLQNLSIQDRKDSSSQPATSPLPHSAPHAPSPPSPPYPSSSAISNSKPLSQIQSISHAAVPPTHPPASRSHPPTNALKRTSPFQFGTRFLEASDDVFAWNAWDHVDPALDPGFMAYKAQQMRFQRENGASEWDRRRFEAKPEVWWDRFYGVNEGRFFKDRRWIRQEFPVLGTVVRNWVVEEEAEAGKEAKAEGGREDGVDGREEVEGGEEGASEGEAAEMNGSATSTGPPPPFDGDEGPWDTILEIGAGAGNTVFPLLKHNRNQNLMIHAVDFSKKAVALMQSSDLFNPKHMVASQWDIASESLPSRLSLGSVDVVVLIFAFSALSPKQWVQAVRNVYRVLRPGGEVCFRDYGRGDLAQVRFKKGRWLGENFYVRGDGTRVYFFEEDELRRIWGGRVEEAAEEALAVDVGEEGDVERGGGGMGGTYLTNEQREMAFEIVSLGTDRRLLVNRQKQLKMYRCWMQGRFRKSGM